MAKAVNVIRKENAYEQNSYTYYPVIIIGAGESGIALGCRLKEVLGCDQFRIFDRQAGIGGTWHINRYPGIACDVPAIVYSFSFNQNKTWTTLHPSGREIVQYLQGTCEKYQIVDKIQLNTDVSAVRWLEDEEEWEVIVTYLAPGLGDLSYRERQALAKENGDSTVYLGTETLRAKIVASAVGGFTEPKIWPDHISGIDTFQGHIVHTARWRDDIDFNGKDVIVLGTGCSAAQVIPPLLETPYNVKSLTQLMRSPPWVPPNLFSEEGVKKFEEWSPYFMGMIPGFNNFIRKLMACVMDLEWHTIYETNDFANKQRAKVEAGFIQHLKKSVPDKYQEILTPDYPFGTKRRVIDDGWFKALRNPKVNLTTQPLSSVQANGVTLGPGRHWPSLEKTESKAPTDKVELPADVIVLANGYDTDVWRNPLNVRGRGGKSIKEYFDERGGPQAYMSTAMDGFPNYFFIGLGPNSATGHHSVILATENMVNHALKFMRPILKGDVKTYEIKESAERSYTTKLQAKTKKTVFASKGVKNWYMYDDGWNAPVYPWSQLRFTLACMFPKWTDWNVQYTRQGLLKRRLHLLVRGFAVLTLAAGIIWAKRSGRGMRDLVRMGQEQLVSSFHFLRTQLLRI